MTKDSSLPDQTDWEMLQTGASMLCGLLGRVLFSYPERDWLKPILEHDLFDEVPFASEQPDVVSALALLGPWSNDHRGELAQESLDQLRADYTRLFIGPDRVLAPPWESVHRSVDRLLFQEQTLQVREWYRRFGLEVANIYREPDDHVALELALLSHVAGLAAKAAEDRDEAALLRLIDAERDFLAQHPVNWVPEWSEMVVRQARTVFYRGVALLTRGAIAELAALLDVAVPAWGLESDAGDRYAHGGG